MAGALGSQSKSVGSKRGIYNAHRREIVNSTIILSENRQIINLYLFLVFLFHNTRSNMQFA